MFVGYNRDTHNILLALEGARCTSFFHRQVLQYISVVLSYAQEDYECEDSLPRLQFAEGQDEAGCTG